MAANADNDYRRSAFGLISMHPLYLLVLCFFADKTLSDASTDKIFFQDGFPGEHSPSATYLLSFASIYLLALCMRCCSHAILPHVILLQPIQPPPTYIPLLAVLCLASHSCMLRFVCSSLGYLHRRGFFIDDVSRKRHLLYFYEIGRAHV